METNNTCLPISLFQMNDAGGGREKKKKKTKRCSNDLYAYRIRFVVAVHCECAFVQQRQKLDEFIKWFHFT